MNFFSPQTHNLTSDGGTSGKCCTSEIPILYYTVAALYGIFGYHEYIYRIFNTLLFFLGLFFLFRLLHYLLKDVFWSIALTLLFFTSPVLVYYGNNFLSNSSALAFSIMGWYYFLRFYSESGNRKFYLAVIFFILAAAFKVTALFSLFAIIAMYIWELLGRRKFKGDKKLFDRNVPFFLPIVSGLFLICFWLGYAYFFNKQHRSTYFSTTVFPIWDLDMSGIRGVLDNIRQIWLDQYFHISVLLFLAICFLFVIVFFRKNNAALLFCVLFISLEVIAYILLQFWTFRDHDYYTIDIYILPVLIIVTTFDTLKRNFFNIFNSPISKIAFALFFLFNVYSARQKSNDRYNGWMNDYSQNKDIYEITPYLRQIGISAADTIISIPDRSHASLYLMDQKGWTEYTDEKFNAGTRIHYNQDSAGIQTSINRGAKYLILNGISLLKSQPYLQNYCTSLIGWYNNVLIFDLKNRAIEETFYCNTETLSADGQYFTGGTDSALFEYGNSRTDKFFHSGKYSSRLNTDLPYGMTMKFKNVKSGEIFRISVWRKTTGQAKGGLVASSSPNKYYNNDYAVLKTDSAGWQKISIICVIPPELDGQELVVYAFNPDGEAEYFDDLEIIRNKSALIKN
mgnify:CR=1 FL=1